MTFDTSQNERNLKYNFKQHEESQGGKNGLCLVKNIDPGKTQESFSF